MKSLRVIPAAVMMICALIATAGTASAHPAQSNGPLVCRGGNAQAAQVIPAGTYSSIVVKGVCSMPAGTVIVKHNLTVGPKALLDAVTPGDPAGANAQLPATVLVRGSVNVGQGGVLLLGSSPDQNPTLAVNYDRIGGNLTGFGALAIVVHSATIRGSVSLFGGGGGVGGAMPGMPPVPGNGACLSPTAPAPPAPWPGGPVFSDFEDSTIGGNYTVVGLRTCWFGTFRTTIGGSTTLVGNRTGDPDGNEIATNRTGGNMVCLSVLPAVQFGDSGGSPNIVGHSAIGDCGFNVMKPTTPPEAATPVTKTHITVRAASLRTFVGVHTQIAHVASLLPTHPPVVTASGDTLTADVYNAVLAGRGLTGPTTAFDPTAEFGSTAEAVLTTTHPNGSAQFTAVDNCACKFQGRSGTVTLEAYGTTTARGFTNGTFVIRSAQGGLTTLAGWGTFTSAHQPAGSLLVIEHLRIT